MTKFDFLSTRKFGITLSLVVVTASILLLIVNGLNLGIDFTGGTEFTIIFRDAVEIADLRVALGAIPADGIDLAGSVITEIRETYNIIITTPLNIELHHTIITSVETMLEETFPAEEISRRAIGGRISREMVHRGWGAILLALVGILLYVSWRFRLRYAVGAVTAVVHDVIITLGVFVLFQLEVNLATIAAFLTIIGYSLNDTIVIFDRVRENLAVEKRASIFDVINRSINQSLTRTINTSLTTLIPVVILFIVGGPVLRSFAVALIIGVIVGTYSSIYVANPVLYAWTMRADSPKR
ncbi:protein translocase subunit SecF [Candidatus Acetothermia bacterium]|jgi:preprotein translocase subunit SecF|nr:protein translocase subunit SecF [Candidatus Acetothermia bacterium]MCI2427567.1 protein translocase subunit SecF [Candidatus Acetothermia bacterium]MCI2428243.1 protein translocase subunit SecF [Candidatus Acetothermia bacterium]